MYPPSENWIESMNSVIDDSRLLTREGEYAAFGCIFQKQKCSLRLHILPPYNVSYFDPWSNLEPWIRYGEQVFGIVVPKKSNDKRADLRNRLTERR